MSICIYTNILKYLQLFFREEEPNNKIKVVSNELDESAPYPTKAIRNTVQIKLNGMVPKNWLPFMSTFVPAIKTDFVDEVIDFS
jgi:hypothetical protein